VRWGAANVIFAVGAQKLVTGWMARTSARLPEAVTASVVDTPANADGIVA
jgi:hypothetical protein